MATQEEIQELVLPDGPLPDSDFDPHAQRTPAHSSGYGMSLINLVKGIVGTGILTMPLAVLEAGILTTAMLLLVMGSCVIYSMHRLLWCNYEICKYFKLGHIGYNQSFRISLAHGPYIFRKLSPHSPKIITIFNFICQAGICVIYYLFSCEVVLSLADQDKAPWNKIEVYIALLAVPLLILVISFHNMRLISIISLTGNFAVLVGLLTSLSYCIMNITKEKFEENNKQYSTLIPVMKALGVSVFSLVAVGVVVSVEEHCAEPHSYVMPCGILNLGLGIPAVISFVVGILGYVCFGDSVKANYIRNIPHGDPLGTVSLLFFGASVFFSYPIHVYPCVDILLKHFKEKVKKFPTVLDMTFRISMVVISCIFAAVVPYLGSLVSLIGALCMTSLGIVFPSLMELCLRWPSNYGRFHFHFLKGLLLFVFGLFCTAIGTVAAIQDIIDNFEKDRQAQNASERMFLVKNLARTLALRVPQSMSESAFNYTNSSTEMLN